MVTRNQRVVANTFHIGLDHLIEIEMCFNIIARRLSYFQFTFFISAKRKQYINKITGISGFIYKTIYTGMYHFRTTPNPGKYNRLTHRHGFQRGI